MSQFDKKSLREKKSQISFGIIDELYEGDLGAAFNAHHILFQN